MTRAKQILDKSERKEDYAVIVADPRDIDDVISSFEDAIDDVFGGYVYKLPESDDSDILVAVVSKKQLNNKQIMTINKEVASEE